MKRWLEFDIVYVKNMSAIIIRLEVKKQDDPPENPFSSKPWVDTESSFGRVLIRVYPWWHTPRDIERKVIKAKEKLLRRYKKRVLEDAIAKPYTDAMELISTHYSKDKILIEDPRTTELVSFYAAQKEKGLKI